MTYHSEHQRMKPVLAVAQQWDVSKSSDPHAVFDPGLSGFALWALPHDQPDGWADVPMDQGVWPQPSAYVGVVRWGWAGEEITHLRVSTDAYNLRDHDAHLARGQRRSPRNPCAYHNRPQDLYWCGEKIRWLFQQAGMPCPPIKIQEVENG